jgi:hypothetical protein
VSDATTPPPGTPQTLTGTKGLDPDPPCAHCGFQPLALHVMTSGGATGFPRNKRFWYMASAARRLDFAHRQLERARAAVDAYVADPAQALTALADVEAAFEAMHRAIEMAEYVRRKYRTGVRLPKVIKQKRRTVKKLRDAYEHIDDRALGIVGYNGRTPIVDQAAAHSLFAEGGYGKALIERREVAYRDLRFGIEAEATELLVALRGFLNDAWHHMCDSGERDEAGAAP